MNPESLLALFTEDSSGIPHNVPNAKYDKWEINSLGFRGKEIDLEKREGQIRIVCLGVSETFGFFESKDKEWPSQLGEMLKVEFPRVEVINVSVVGLSLKDNKNYVEKYVLPLKPDVMILMQTFLIYTKDLIRGVGSKAVTNSIKEIKTRNPVKAAECAAIPSRVLPRLGKTFVALLPESLLKRMRLWRLRGKVRRKEKRYLVHKEPMDKVPEDVILEFEEDLRLFVQYLKENHIVPVLSTYPALITPFNRDVYEKISLLTRLRFCIELSEHGIMDASQKSNDTVRNIAKERDLIFIDNDYMIPKTLEYFGDNFHYTDKGAESIAKNFYYLLNHYGLIK